MVVHTFNPNTEEAETGRSLWDQGQSAGHSEFQARMGFMMRYYLKKKKIKQKPTNQQQNTPRFLKIECINPEV